MSSKSGLNKNWIWLIPVLALVLYFNTLSNQFALDDDVIFTNNSLVKAGFDDVYGMLSNFSFEQENVSFSYRPVLVVSFAVQKALFGYDAESAHLVNILLYAITCLVIFFLAKRILGPERWILAFIASLIFCIHPIHSEVVNNIKSRDEILALMFGSLAIIAAIRAVDEEKPLFLLLFLPLSLLSAFSKDNGAILIAFTPVVLIFLKLTRKREAIIICLLSALVLILKLPVYHLAPRLLVGIFYVLACITGFWVSGRFFSKEPWKFPDDQIERALPNWEMGSIFTTASLAILAILSIAFKLQISMAICLVVSFLFFRYANFRALPSILLILFGLSISSPVLISMGASLCLIFWIESNDQKTGLIYLFPILLGCLNFDWIYLILVLLVGGIFFSQKKYQLGLKAIIPLIVIAIVMFVVLMENFWGTSSTIIFSAIAFLSVKELKPELNKYWPCLYSAVGICLCIGTFNPAATNDLQRIAIWNNKEIYTTEKSDSLVIEAYTEEVGKKGISREIMMSENPLNYLSSGDEKAGLSAATLGFYIKKSLWAQPFSFYYGYDTIPLKSIWNLENLFWFILGFSSLILGIVLFLRFNPIGLAILFFYWNLFPFLNIWFPAPGLVAERFLFTSSFGFCILLVLSVDWIIKKNEIKLPKFFWHSSIAVLCVFAGLLITDRNKDWNDIYTLVSQDIDAVPRSAKVNQLYATNLMTEALDERNNLNLEMVQKAIEHFNICLSVDPNFPFANFDLGQIYLILEDPQSALIYFKRSTAIDSLYSEAPFYTASLYQDFAQNDSAEMYYKESIRRNPLYIYSYTNLSMLYFTMEDYEKSIQVNHNALLALPNSYAPKINIGKTYFHINQLDSALRYLNLAYEMNPNEPGLAQVISETKFKLENQ